MPGYPIRAKASFTTTYSGYGDFALGDIACDEYGSKYRFVKYSASAAASAVVRDVVYYDGTTDWTVIDTLSVGNVAGIVVATTVTAGDFCWVKVWDPNEIATNINCATGTSFAVGALVHGSAAASTCGFIAASQLVKSFAITANCLAGGIVGHLKTAYGGALSYCSASVRIEAR